MAGTGGASVLPFTCLFYSEMIMGSLVPVNVNGLYPGFRTIKAQFLQPWFVSIVINGTAVFIMPGSPNQAVSYRVFMQIIKSLF